MIETCSPHRDGSSPVHLHSPHRLRYCDSHPALGEIQRSLTRSPSKASEHRQNTFRNLSPSLGTTPFQPSPLSLSRRSTSDLLVQAAVAMSSPFVTRNTPRTSRTGFRRTAQTTGALRTRTSPKSPSKRILVDSSSSGNSSPMPLRKRTSDEVDREQGIETNDFAHDKENAPIFDENLATKHVYTRQEKRRSGGSLMNFMPPKSPMKRPEPTSSFGNSDFESPSAKRRSLHGPNMDFSIFESESLSSMDEPRSQDDNDWLRSVSSTNSSRFSTIPKRSSSLRKSTIQQRQAERAFQSKFAHVMDFEPTGSDATPLAKGTHKEIRLSLDNHLQPMQRDSPFSAQGNLLSASVHPATSAQNSQQLNSFSQHSRHPLSRTMTQSSSTSSMQEDDSPTHEPMHRPIRPRSDDFSRSLPLGAMRPTPSASQESEYSSQGSFATPANYKSAKPLPAAFMSTGLISKKNRNIDHPNAGLPKAHMPDTPCKKQSIMLTADEKFKRPSINHTSRVSFGTPATPLDSSKMSVMPFAKSVGLFGPRPSRPSLMRKASFASITSERNTSSQSPSHQQESQSTDSSDFPPTPTKHFQDPSHRASISPSPHHSRNLSMPGYSGSTPGTQFATSKLSPIQGSPGELDGDSDTTMDDSPSAGLKPKSALRAVALPGISFTRGRVLKNLSSPTPLSRKALSTPALERTKSVVFSPVTPIVEHSDRFSPHTPQESCFPPDPSGLSISGRVDRPVTRGGPSPAIPATPTGPREYFPNFSNRASLNLSTAHVTNADSSLISRFENVDLVGTGEFSQVYRVSQPPTTSPYHKIYSVSTPQRGPKGSEGRVWAVKKSRYPYSGPKDRLRKLEEVNALRALGRSDHVVTFTDSWEHEGHLYIQTEFCEEGTLGVFLENMGQGGRLDDFRIWKILLEMSLGLKYIHESGFIHLDLKPANILITFEGVLKIADFGMAARWPAQAGIEGEGDREYIGPEILAGTYDKPADIFALGLVLLEIAGNVVLPDNGTPWQKLRNGDMSDVPSLTWTSFEASSIIRDASGNPIPMEQMPPTFKDHDQDIEIVDSDDFQGQEELEHRERQRRESNLMLERPGELIDPPIFMIEASNEQSLDNIVRWMISPNPSDRPLASDLLGIEGAVFVSERRRAGATVYEGNWGPADMVLAEDAEMLDV